MLGRIVERGCEQIEINVYDNDPENGFRGVIYGDPDAEYRFGRVRDLSFFPVKGDVGKIDALGLQEDGFLEEAYPSPSGTPKS
jgi:hypothetical protein